MIVINPVKGDSPKIIASLKRAREAGIKIIAVDSQLSHFTVDASVVSDNYQAGVLVAQRLMKQKNEAKILLLEHKGDGIGRATDPRILRYHPVEACLSGRWERRDPWSNGIGLTSCFPGHSGWSGI